MNACKNCKHARKNRNVLGIVWYRCTNLNSRHVLDSMMPWELCGGYEEMINYVPQPPRPNTKVKP